MNAFGRNLDDIGQYIFLINMCSMILFVLPSFFINHACYKNSNFASSVELYSTIMAQTLARIQIWTSTRVLQQFFFFHRFEILHLRFLRNCHQVQFRKVQRLIYNFVLTGLGYEGQALSTSIILV